MKNILQFLILVSLTLTGLISAHPGGHDKPQTIYKDQAITTATYRIEQLIKKQQLDKSWQEVKATDAIYKRRDARYTWIVSFSNPEQDKDKQTLYVFLTGEGYFITTNFTGK